MIRFGLVAGLDLVLVVSVYMHSWALRQDMVDMALIVTLVGRVTLLGLTLLAALLRRWNWALFLASLSIAFLLLLSMTALLY